MWPQRISASTLYFWDDQPDGGVAEPTGWKLQYLQDGRWIDIVVPGGYPLAGKQAPSHVAFAPVTTTGLRAVIDTAVQGAGHAALGVDEWQVAEPVGDEAGEVVPFPREDAPHLLRDPPDLPS